MIPKILLAQINTTVGDLEGNRQKILLSAKKAQDLGASILITPGMALSGAPLNDLLFQKSFMIAIEKSFNVLLQESQQFPQLSIIVGMPFKINNQIYLGAQIICNGKILKRIYETDNVSLNHSKVLLLTKNEPILNIQNTPIAVTMAKNIDSSDFKSVVSQKNPSLVIALDCTNYVSGQIFQRLGQYRMYAQQFKCPIIYANALGANDETIYDGSSFATNENGTLTTYFPSFKEHCQIVELQEKTQPQLLMREDEIYQALCLGLKDYCHKNGFKNVIVGLSGGVDSALVCTIAADTLGPENVHAVMMSSRYTSDISKEDAQKLANNLNINYQSISIDESFSQLNNTLETLFDNPSLSITQENLQARIRGLLLMGLSNQINALVLTTSNKSEIAVGYSTLYGDMVGGFALLKDIYKTDVYRLCKFRNKRQAVIPTRILTRAPTAELKENQTDQDTLPAYSELDQILKRIIDDKQTLEEIIRVGHDKETVIKIDGLIRRNEYKRSQAPIGLIISKQGFSKNRMMPLTSKFKEQLS